VAGASRFEGLRGEYEADGRAEHYAADRWSRTAHGRRTNRREQEIVSRWLRACAPVTSALDLPSGAGRFCALLESGAGRLTSVDAARRMLAQHGGAARLQASAHALPFAGGSFDLVLCSRLLHHLEDAAERRSVLTELARVSRRWAIVSHFDRGSFQAWRSRWRRRADGRHALAPAQFRAEAAAAGWIERDRAWVLRGISEQTWALLERQPSP
jgi:SAM-dependent methyltransferase